MNFLNILEIPYYVLFGIIGLTYDREKPNEYLTNGGESIESRYYYSVIRHNMGEIRD